MKFLHAHTGAAGIRWLLSLPPVNQFTPVFCRSPLTLNRRDFILPSSTAMAFVLAIHVLADTV